MFIHGCPVAPVGVVQWPGIARRKDESGRVGQFQFGAVQADLAIEFGFHFGNADDTRGGVENIAFGAGRRFPGIQRQLRIDLEIRRIAAAVAGMQFAVGGPVPVPGNRALVRAARNRVAFLLQGGGVRPGAAFDPSLQQIPGRYHFRLPKTAMCRC